jgi:enoyl-CoA hydratase/carnithine racemase
MDPLKIEFEDGLTRLILNRPDKRNALSADLVEALLAGLRTAEDDGSRLVVVQGSGSAFCAGFDFTGIADQSDGDLALRFLRVEQLLQALRHASTATLALVHGPCFGAGADIVAACSQRVAAPGATFRMPGLRFGVVLGSRRLADLIGTDAARRLLGTSRRFDAGEALRTGFVQEIRPLEDWPAVVDAAREAARTLAPAALRAMLERTATDSRDADMAALARSVAEPGLRDRIVAFLDESRPGSRD